MADPRVRPLRSLLMWGPFGVVARGRAAARKVLSTYRLSLVPPIYTVGTFDHGITVFRQQVRALNLVWSMLESGMLPSRRGDVPVTIAIIGGGFAGLTVAAGLLEKGVPCTITLFEQRDALLPLQQGSDTRWLHPHIYDWPDARSEADVAMLPILNWHAARASDVVSQVLDGWAKVKDVAKVKLYCNTRHLQISPDPEHRGRSRIEWVGQRRKSADGNAADGVDTSLGEAKAFDHVILAAGFGVEEGRPSYWRNETFGQPELDQSRRMHIVSGGGDGAMIDLLRLRLSQFRQDRILEELFAAVPGLKTRLRGIKAEFDAARLPGGLFPPFERLFAGEEAGLILTAFARRLRRDTDAVLSLTVRNLTELLKSGRMSFQNALLVYLLYRCGGFVPSSLDDRILREQYAVPDAQVVRRHGTRRMQQLRAILWPELFARIEARSKRRPERYLRQDGTALWPGGYFGFTGRQKNILEVRDEQGGIWRREYLPGPTELVATALCGSIAGTIDAMRPDARHFRVTLHRVLPFHDGDLLQQCCAYAGRGLGINKGAAGRTYPVDTATIGLAFGARRPVRSRRGTTPQRLQAVMDELGLPSAAQRMRPDVRYLLALPVLQPDGHFFLPSPTCAVLYVDSADEGFDFDHEEIETLRSTLGHALQGLAGGSLAGLGGVRNVPLEDMSDRAPFPRVLAPSMADALELLGETATPRTANAFVLNYDYADPAPITTV